MPTEKLDLLILKTLDLGPLHGYGIGQRIEQVSGGVFKVTLGSLWLVRTVEDGPIKAFSTVCPHLGCGVDFDDKTGKFNCPCHASAFDLDGRCLGGPSPRGLDQLETQVEGRDVLVRYQRFRVGSSKREPLG